MNLKKVFQNRKLRNGLCTLLAAALLLSLVLPALGREQAQLNKPQTGAEVQDIQVIHTGEEENMDASSQQSVSDKEGEGQGQPGEEEGREGQEVPGESAENSSGVSQQKLSQNAQGTAQPNSGPALEGLADATIGTTNSTDDMGEQGQNDGDQGEEGGEQAELDLAMVMTWYKYGTEPRTIVCNPGSTVGKQILLGQLRGDELEYEFEATGSDAEELTITSVSYGIGNAVPEEIDERGFIDVNVPTDPGYRNYIFTVEAVHRGRDAQGEAAEQNVSFTYVIRCENGRDLELQLHWDKADGQQSTITCMADGEAGREINRSELAGGALSYLPELTGELAEDSEIIAAEYNTRSGQYGTLETTGGTLELKVPDGEKQETYYLRFTALASYEDDEGDLIEETISYTVTIVFQDNMDLQLRFTWYDRGVSARQLKCDLNAHVSGNVKVNQLSAGSLMYSMELVGDSADSARIKGIALQDDSGSRALEQSGSVAMSVAAGEASALYKFVVTVEADEQTVYFTVAIRLSHDIRLQMDYELLVDGVLQPQRVYCENGKTVKAETVYNDQLSDGVLNYTLSLTGDESEGMQIVRVECFQSGNLKNQVVSAEGSVTLLTDGRRVGENRFTVTAVDSFGDSYIFKINIPYLNRGENIVRIETNLQNGMEVTNGADINLRVRAWTEDENGKTISNIRNEGSETILTVTLDEGEVRFVSSSGEAEEFILVPANPEVGDTKVHTLTIYAQDEFGNYGEEKITLVGKRSQNGQKIGTAQIYIDMTVIGLGVTGPISYDVLSEEPISYVVAKSVWGYDAGFPFGTARETFGYQGGEYRGEFDTGFYLMSLSPGGRVDPIAMTGTSWRNFGSNRDEILAGIDAWFGEEYKDYATLWRCIYNNGLNLSTRLSDSAIAQDDFTSGSGWSYAIGTGTYYPGLGMDSYSLKDGEILTLRYTLADGWDIGNGVDNTSIDQSIGYCVTAYGGNLYVNHNYPDTPNADGSYTCRSCLRQSQCSHDNSRCTDNGDGSHSISCVDCEEPLGTSYLQYTNTENPLTHTVSCDACGMVEAEEHWWIDQGSTATCITAGVRTVWCPTCGITQEQAVEATGIHVTGGMFRADTENFTQHYELCTECENEIEGSRSVHRYEYVAAELDWKCVDCGVRHDMGYGHWADNVETTCTESIWFCTDCNMNFYSPGDGTSHFFELGSCSYCGAEDPAWVPEETP